MKNILKSLLIPSFLISAFFTISAYKPDTEEKTGTGLEAFSKSFSLAPSGAAVVNPHKGFVQYAWRRIGGED